MRSKFLTLVIILMTALPAMAQREEPNLGLDLVSDYVWRGLKIGSGPAMQPKASYTVGGFTTGAWGSYCFSTNEAMESNIFLSYKLWSTKESSITVAVNDYYFPPVWYFKASSHYFEPNVTFHHGTFGVLYAYMFNAKDTYVQADINFDRVIVTVGAGDGQYTDGNGFGLCNISMKSSKDLLVSDHLKLPMSIALILNPTVQQMYVVATISF